jgi:hypothetical protein
VRGGPGFRGSDQLEFYVVPAEKVRGEIGRAAAGFLCGPGGRIRSCSTPDNQPIALFSSFFS